MAEQPDLFPPPAREGLHVLQGFALVQAGALLAAVEAVTAAAPFRRMQVPGGGTMSAAMSNCGTAGWVSGLGGYRYAREDPLTGKPWPDMPDAIRDVAVAAAEAAGFAFAPDACLINLYEPGARMGLHRDLDELDAASPVVSVSLGLAATFQFGGRERSDPVGKIRLEHGDVVVWGGPLRRAWHGIATIRDGVHPLVGRRRINLTVRKAL